MKDHLQFVQKTLFIFLTLLGISFGTYAQNWDQIIKASAGDRNSKPSGTRSAGDSYGYSVSVYGTYAVVGAPKEDEDASGKNTLEDAGAAYILHFVNGSWKQVKKLCPSKRDAQNNFGFSVSISGSYVVVGAHAEAHYGFGVATLDYAGAAYIFSKDYGGESNWGQVKRITASQPHASDQFGYSVAISGEHVVVGAVLESEDASGGYGSYGSGTAYIFRKDLGGSNNWGQLKKIVASDRAGSDEFGYSVAISGDNIVVGAYRKNLISPAGTVVWNAGAAYVFNRLQGGTDNWGQAGKIVATTLLENGAFGHSVAISGDHLIVGAVGSENYAGSAYIFGRNKGGTNYWGFVRKFVAYTPAPDDHFGHAVAIYGDCAVVGAPFESLNGNEVNTVYESGSAYIYKRNQGGADNWGKMKKITAPYRQEYDHFGSAVAVFTENAFIGAAEEDDDESESNLFYNAGSAYVYKASNGGFDNWGFVKKMIMEEKTPDNNFGYSVSISGKYAIVGAPFEDEDKSGQNTSLDAGAAYIFYNDGSKWSQIKKITATTRWANDNFGQAVSINGKYAVVGAPQANMNGIEEGYLDNAGAAYIFYMDQGGAGKWGQVKKITPLNRNTNDMFGNSVSMGENTVIVGAPLTDGGNTIHQYGSAYIFAKDQGSTNGWGQVKELTAPIRLNDAFFGQSVSISGNYALIGASGDSYNSGQSVIPYTGAAYLFKKDASTGNVWKLVKKIYANAHTALDQFGYSVSISGTTAVVGAYAESENIYEADSQHASGSAYIFKKDQGGSENWGQFKKLTASDRAKDDRFGYSVSISGNWVIVGAHQEDENALGYGTYANTGSAYIFRRDQNGSNAWGQVQKITAVNRHPFDQFGFSVSISDTYAMVGSPWDSEDASEQNLLAGAGSALIFHSTPTSTARTEATAFEAEQEENRVLISWTPAAGMRFNHFEVQRSTNGISWETIREMTAAETDTTEFYTYADDEPVAGKNFYQLKTVDLDGNSAFTEIKSLYFNAAQPEIRESKKTLIYPNPVVDKLYISAEEVNNVAGVSIINTTGRVVVSASQLTANGIETGHLAAGMYIVQIRKTNGRMEAQKIVVVK